MDDKLQGNIHKKMLESRPEDALGSLVLTVLTILTALTVLTVLTNCMKHVSFLFLFFYFAPFPNSLSN